MTEIKRPKNRFDKRFDILRDREVFGYSPKQSSNRALKKLQSNRLAVIGLSFVILTISASVGSDKNILESLPDINSSNSDIEAENEPSIPENN